MSITTSEEAQTNWLEETKARISLDWMRIPDRKRETLG